MTRTATPKHQESSSEVVIELRACTAGEQILATFDRPVYAMLYSALGYKVYSKSRRDPVISLGGEPVDDLHTRFTIASDGDWYLVVEPDVASQPLPHVTVARHHVDPVQWNDTHADHKIVRLQPVPHGAPMASTLSYWERKADFHLPAVWACQVCYDFLPRDQARCALVTVVGELPRRDYVLPVCPHCYAAAHGRTFLTRPTFLAAAPVL